MKTRAPLVFGIGLPFSGACVLHALFTANGRKWQHDLRGRLARSIAYARVKGTVPLKEWPNATGFSGLTSAAKLHMPHLRVQDLFRTLHAAFPDAYFVLTTRAADDWIAARFLADDGAHRRAAAWHAALTEADLPDFWRDEQAAHTADCAAYFGANPRYIEWNTTTQPLETLKHFFRADFELNTQITLPDLSVNQAAIDMVAALISADQITAPHPEPDMTFARQVIDFCAQKQGAAGTTKALSPTAVHWAQANTVLTLAGKPTPLVRDGDVFLNDATAKGLDRAHGTINDLIAHGCSPDGPQPLYIDMMDARAAGSGTKRPAPRHTVVYNRRPAAPNMTLWPLVGYHTLAPTGAPGGFPVDHISFEDKHDRVVWRGNMSGRMSPVLAPGGRDLHSVYAIRDRALTGSGDWHDIMADLDCVPRYRTVKTFRDHPDFDIGFVLRDTWAPLIDSPPFRGLTSPLRPLPWFHRFRYILSLAGNDTGSNFLSAAASNALIFKEEDGWELFYTGLFKPWIHYVPLALAAVDIEEKLRWARANQAACAAMVAASSAVFEKLAHPPTRAAILRGIAAGLNAVTSAVK